MPDERQDSMKQGIGAPPESETANQAAEARRRRNAESPEIGGEMGGTSDTDSPGEEASYDAARSDAGRKPAPDTPKE